MFLCSLRSLIVTINITSITSDSIIITTNTMTTTINHYNTPGNKIPLISFIIDTKL